VPGNVPIVMARSLPGPRYEESGKDSRPLFPFLFPFPAYVSANGGIRWNSDWVNVSIVCAGEYVGLEEIDDGIWNVYFGPRKLGRLHERHMRIEDEYGRLKRHKV